MYVCIYICYIYIYIYMCTERDTCICIYIYIHTYMYTIIYIHVCKCIYIHTCIYIYIHTYVYTLCMCICKYIMYIRIHVYICICVYVFVSNHVDMANSCCKRIAASCMCEIKGLRLHYNIRLPRLSIVVIVVCSIMVIIRVSISFFVISGFHKRGLSKGGLATLI